MLSEYPSLDENYGPVLTKYDHSVITHPKRKWDIITRQYNCHDDYYAFSRKTLDSLSVNSESLLSSYIDAEGDIGVPGAVFSVFVQLDGEYEFYAV